MKSATLILFSLLAKSSDAFQPVGAVRSSSSPSLLHATGTVQVDRLTAVDAEAPDRARWAGDRVQSRIQAQVEKKAEQGLKARQEAARLAREANVAEEVRRAAVTEAERRGAAAVRAQWVGERVAARIQYHAKKDEELNKETVSHEERARKAQVAQEALLTAQAEAAARVSSAENAKWASERVVARLEAQVKRKAEAESKVREESLRLAIENKIMQDAIAMASAEARAKAASAERANWAAARVEARIQARMQSRLGKVVEMVTP